MKKIVLLALLAISMLPVYSQTSVGIIAGYNQNFIHPKGAFNDPFYDLSSLSGWRAGLISEHHLGGKFYLQPQLLLNSKGFKYGYYSSVPGLIQKGQNNHRFLSVELQANFVFKQELGNGKLVIGAGPYIGRGFSGLVKSKYESGYSADSMNKGTTYTVIKYRNKIPTLETNEYAGNVIYSKPYDFGFNCQVGYELKNGLFFNAVYSLGLSSRAYEKSSPFKEKPSYFGISVGYFLKRFS